MNDLNINFEDFEELHNSIQKQQSGSILVAYQNIPDYDGMVLGIGMIFDIIKSKYELDLQWISFGLDLFGENLLENYLYSFNGLAELLAYLKSHYNIAVSDIPRKYKIDNDLFPNPIKDGDKKPVFEAAWQKFQIDFKSGKFLDDSLELVFSSTS